MRQPLMPRRFTTGFVTEGDRCYVHLFEYLEPENNHGAKNWGKDKTAKTGAQLVKLRFSKAF